MNVVSVDLGMGPDPTSLVVLEGRTWERVRLERIETRYSISFASVYRRPDGSESVGCPPRSSTFAISRGWPRARPTRASSAG